MIERMKAAMCILFSGDIYHLLLFQPEQANYSWYSLKLPFGLEASGTNSALSFARSISIIFFSSNKVRIEVN